MKEWMLRFHNLPPDPKKIWPIAVDIKYTVLSPSMLAVFPGLAPRHPVKGRATTAARLRILAAWGLKAESLRGHVRIEGQKSLRTQQ